MKTIEKVKTIESKYEVYVANDGTEFTTAEECKKYEESAFGVLNVRYKELVIGRTTEYDLLNTGCEDNGVDIVKVKTEADKDVVLQMYFLVNPHLKRGFDEGYELYTKWVERAKSLLNAALEEDDYLFICRGYDDEECFWFIGTRASILAHLNEIIAGAEEDK